VLLPLGSATLLWDRFWLVRLLGLPEWSSQGSRRSQYRLMSFPVRLLAWPALSEVRHFCCGLSAIWSKLVAAASRGLHHWAGLPKQLPMYMIVGPHLSFRSRWLHPPLHWPLCYKPNEISVRVSCHLGRVRSGAIHDLDTRLGLPRGCIVADFSAGASALWHWVLSMVYSPRRC